MNAKDAPTRVAQVMGYMNGGGVEAVVMNYYRHIDRSRVQFDLLVCEGSTSVPREEIESLGGRVFMVPAYSHLLEFQRTLRRLFEHEGWRIVHSHMNTLSVFSLRAAKEAGVPVRIAHSHNTSGKGEHARNAMKYTLRPLANVYPTHRMACSKYAGEWLFGKGAEFDLMYNAIDLPAFFFNAKARVRARADMGLDRNQLVIGHVGRFMPQKNHTFLLEAFATLLEKRNDAILLLVGDGELRSSAESWVAERGLSGKVRFLGQRDDVARLYSAFDAFALPSLYEGLGLVGVEAQEAGLPCLLSKAIPREVDVTGKCKFLAIDDPAVWANAMANLLVGKRNPVYDGDFANYDIEQQSKWLTSKYIGYLAEF